MKNEKTLGYKFKNKIVKKKVHNSNPLQSPRTKIAQRWGERRKSEKEKDYIIHLFPAYLLYLPPCCLCTLSLIMSSIRRIEIAASVANRRLLILEIAGSTTPAARLSRISPLYRSRPENLQREGGRVREGICDI